MLTKDWMALERLATSMSRDERYTEPRHRNLPECDGVRVYAATVSLLVNANVGLQTSGLRFMSLLLILQSNHTLYQCRRIY